MSKLSKLFRGFQLRRSSKPDGEEAGKISITLPDVCNFEFQGNKEKGEIPINPPNVGNDEYSDKPYANESSSSAPATPAPGLKTRKTWRARLRLSRSRRSTPNLQSELASQFLGEPTKKNKKAKGCFSPFTNKPRSNDGTQSDFGFPTIQTSSEDGSSSSSSSSSNSNGKRSSATSSSGSSFNNRSSMSLPELVARSAPVSPGIGIRSQDDHRFPTNDCQFFEPSALLDYFTSASTVTASAAHVSGMKTNSKTRSYPVLVRSSSSPYRTLRLMDPYRLSMVREASNESNNVDNLDSIVESGVKGKNSLCNNDSGTMPPPRPPKCKLRGLAHVVQDPKVGSSSAPVSPAFKFGSNGMGSRLPLPCSSMPPPTMNTISRLPELDELIVVLNKDISELRKIEKMDDEDTHSQHVTKDDASASGKSSAQTDHFVPEYDSDCDTDSVGTVIFIGKKGSDPLKNYI